MSLQKRMLMAEDGIKLQGIMALLGGLQRIFACFVTRQTELYKYSSADEIMKYKRLFEAVEYFLDRGNY